ncbi:MAG: hypothetical protein IJH77_01900 [Mogibacterium sp.]|nr:hypothetical protein [Mogibacterium sp.]
MPREEIETRIRADIDKINETFPPARRIRRIFITDEPMIKTSTGKVRRFLEIEKMLGTGESTEEESGDEGAGSAELKETAE